LRDTALVPEILQHLPGAAREGTTLVGVSISDEPLKIVTAIDEFVAHPPRPGFLKRVDNWNERAMPLGALWGEQLVRRLGWQWMMVIDDDEEASIGVFDVRRSMGIYPFDYVFECIESRGQPAILLAFNMLAAGTMPSFPDRSYEDIMDGVQHIVPPA